VWTRNAHPVSGRSGSSVGTKSARTSSTSVRVPGRVVRRGRCGVERRRALRSARLVREERMLASPPAYSSPQSIAMRPRVAARSAPSMCRAHRGPAHRGRRRRRPDDGGRETVIWFRRAVQFELCVAQNAVMPSRVARYRRRWGVECWCAPTAENCWRSSRRRPHRHLPLRHARAMRRVRR
jgi:hypothetical protein